MNSSELIELVRKCAPSIETYTTPEIKEGVEYRNIHRRGYVEVHEITMCTVNNEVLLDKLVLIIDEKTYNKLINDLS